MQNLNGVSPSVFRCTSTRFYDPWKWQTFAYRRNFRIFLTFFCRHYFNLQALSQKLPVKITILKWQPAACNKYVNGSTLHWMGPMLVCLVIVTMYRSITECMLASWFMQNWGWCKFGHETLIWQNRFPPPPPQYLTVFSPFFLYVIFVDQTFRYSYFLDPLRNGRSK